ncbi:helix-turn-helix domain-containing protein [Acetobacter sp. TBRC 12305]|uniref:Helix-turn-helix domain-containing protein n=1 Tax=Acetobacter garciniae TaxID=2817435 RepID=A0A939HMX3_9PROT|nr:helix-turn-helix domain-containing protein [Acetobacter garciniae]MBO1324322.1 helix-turn-helix domain-containing protein [Acetobacter garciniae]MBX0344011.1 helix-turn-helix domain-containing protein [Acetobacter garciniae]
MAPPLQTSAFLSPGLGVHPSRQADLQRCLLCDQRDANLCSGLDKQGLAALAQSSKRLVLPPGTTMVEEGEPAVSFFNVTQGTVKLFKSLPDGRRQITGFADPGQFLGLSPSDVYSFGAETVDTVQVCRFQRPQLEGLLSDFPVFERNLLVAVTDRLAEAQEQMLLLGRKTAKEKVASFLLDRLQAHERAQATAAAHDHDEPAATTEHVASVPMTRIDIADYLGLTIETVSRTISALRREKIIANMENHYIQILAPATLRQIASGQQNG